LDAPSALAFLGFLFLLWLCARKNRRKFSLNTPLAELSTFEFIKVYLNPRISLVAIGDCLKKVCTAAKGWIIVFAELWWCFLELITMDFSFGVRVRQEKIKLRFWRNLNRSPRQQNEGIVVKSASIMDADTMDEKRGVFRLVDKRNEKNWRSLTWVCSGESVSINSKWDSSFQNIQAEPDKIFNRADWKPKTHATN
jgi:hypothetical protein